MTRIYRYFRFTAAESWFYLPDPYLKKVVRVFLNVLGRTFFSLFKKGSANVIVVATYFSHICSEFMKADFHVCELRITSEAWSSQPESEREYPRLLRNQILVVHAKLWMPHRLHPREKRKRNHYFSAVWWGLPTCHSSTWFLVQKEIYYRLLINLKWAVLRSGPIWKSLLWNTSKEWLMTGEHT